MSAVFSDPLDAAVARAFERTKPAYQRTAEHEANRLAAYMVTVQASRDDSAAFLKRWREGGRERAMRRYEPPVVDQNPTRAAPARFPYPHRTCAEWA